MPPTTIVDTALSPDHVYFAIEDGHVWRADNPEIAGAATWTEVANAATFPELTDLRFCRILAPGNGLVYALGVTGGSVRDAWFFRSSNNGLTWTAIQIATAAYTQQPYTLTIVDGASTCPAINVRQHTLIPHTRVGDDDSTVNPWAMAYILTGRTGGWNDYHAGDTTINNWGDGNLADTDEDVGKVYGVVNSLLSAGDRLVAQSWFMNYFGLSGVFSDYRWRAGFDSGEMPKDPARIHFDFSTGHDPGTAFWRTYVWWDKPYDQGVTAMDYARTNPSWVYVGFEDKIVWSTDGGYTWTLLTEDYGADDIAVHPTLGSVFACWTPEGELRFWTGLEMLDPVTTAAPEHKAHRLAFNQVNGSRLWMIADGAVKRWDVGTITILKDDFASPVAVRAYARTDGQSTVALMDGAGVWVSLDDGATWANRVGDWAGFSSPVSIHLLV
jgi:hypothetical protein